MRLGEFRLRPRVLPFTHPERILRFGACRLGALELWRSLRKALMRQTRVTASNPSDRPSQATEELSALG